MDDLKKQHAVVFTINDDFDYASRINALRFKKHLGQGGFGMVNLCFDELNASLVAVKHLSYGGSNASSGMLKKEFEALSKL